MSVLPEFYVLCARTSAGKTALSLRWATYQALCGHRVAYYSWEQGEGMTVAKVASLLCGLPAPLITGRWTTTDREEEQIADALDRVAALPLTICSQRMTPEGVASHIAMLREREQIVIAYIDQLDKFIFTTEERTLERRMAAASQTLFSLRQSLEIPIVLLAQLSLTVARTHPKPDMTHLRDCSQVLQDADVVLVLDRPEAEPERFDEYEKVRRKLEDKGDYKAAKAWDWRNLSQLTVGKDRNGSTGKLRRGLIGFEPLCGRFGGPLVDEQEQEESDI